MSNLYEYIKMAVHNIMANKGRSFLTMLGIIIGIASVIAIVSVGEGTKNQMNSEIDDIGGGQIAISVSDEAQTDEEWITADDVEATDGATPRGRAAPHAGPCGHDAAGRPHGCGP